jgi:hypothetical protein
MDKISALIYKHRLLNYPEGQDINAVEYIFRYQEQDNPNQVCKLSKTYQLYVTNLQ